MEKLIQLAIALGKQKMVVEIAERCGHIEGERLDEKKEEYDKRLQAFVQEAHRLSGGL